MSTNRPSYQLTKRAQQLDHNSRVNRKGYTYHHVTSCERCDVENAANNLEISVYEWPLPTDETALKSVVFELSCPCWFACWRDVTWKFLHNFGRYEKSQASDMKQDLMSYREVEKFRVNLGQRLSLGSVTKSWRVTHYGSQRFPVDFEEISVPNGLRFKLLDRVDNVWVGVSVNVRP